MKLKGILILLCLPILIINSSVLGQEKPDIVAIRGAFAQAIEDHDVDAILSHFTEDGVSDATVFPAPLVTHEQMRAMWEDQFDASPDWHTEDGRVLTVDDMVIVEHPAVGTNTRDAAGLPWVWPHLDIYEFEGEKIKRLMSYGDYAGILIQLGMAPAPEPIEFKPSFELPDPEPTGLSPLEANAELVARWNSHDVAGTAKMGHADSSYFAGPLGVPLNRVETAALNEMYFQGFSDARLEPVRTIDMGDGWVVFEHVAHGTHDGTFMGVPASGYPVEIRAVWLTHYDADGLVTQQSFYYDNLTMMTQITTAPEYSPAGTWISSVPTPMGNMTFLHTVSPQEKMGVPYAGIMHPVNGNATLFGMFPEVEKATDYVTQTVHTGRNTCVSTMLNYGTRKGEGPVDETVTIAILHVMWTLTGPETNEGTTILSVYLAEQDADGDGLPDEGQEPVECMPFAFTTRRLTMMPPCTLPPMPEPGQ
jgi:steroid delta-isomerase-like uncharacterized protein